MQIRPVSDLRNKFQEIEEFVLREEQEVYLTKNGYGSMVVMGIDKYTRLLEEIDLAKALELRFGNVDIDKVLSNPNAANKLIKELEEKVKILAVFPKIFSLQMHNDDLVYKFIIQNYSVFYYIQDDTITICNIFYSKRNL